LKPYFVKTPKFLSWIFPNRIWAFSRSEKSIFLTFDDGPIPEVTPWILDILKEYNAKATFFCIGENVAKHPEIFRRIISEGHSVGNHTFNHLNGWNTSTSKYVENVIKAEEIFQKELCSISNEEFGNQNSEIRNFKFFRPPYGKMTSKQSKILQKKGYKIVMWDILSADFDQRLSEEKCLQNVLKNIENGSIVVFHDSLKAEKNLRYVLPKVLENLRSENMCLKVLFNT